MSQQFPTSTIGLDIDGVVADFNGAVNAWVYREHGVDASQYSQRAWSWWREWPNGRKIWDDMWDRGCRKEGLLRQIRPVPGSVMGVHYLQSVGFNIVFVTHRRDEFAEDTLAWLNHNLFPTTVIHSEDKSVAGADLFVDDKPENVRDLLRRNYKAFLFAQDWNIDDQSKLPTFKNWHDLTHRVGEWVSAIR